MKRYSLPKGSTYRAFGSGQIITNENITDEMVEALISQHPEVRKVFIDAGANYNAPVVKPTSELDQLTKKELHSKYASLTGKAADDKINKADLLALVQYELDAKAMLG